MRRTLVIALDLKHVHICTYTVQSSGFVLRFTTVLCGFQRNIQHRNCILHQEEAFYFIAKYQMKQNSASEETIELRT